MLRPRFAFSVILEMLSHSDLSSSTLQHPHCRLLPTPRRLPLLSRLFSHSQTLSPCFTRQQAHGILHQWLKRRRSLLRLTPLLPPGAPQQSPWSPANLPAVLGHYLTLLQSTVRI